METCLYFLAFKKTGTFRALTYVETLKIPAVLFKEFVNRHRPFLGRLKKLKIESSFYGRPGYSANLYLLPSKVILHKNETQKIRKGASITCGGLMWLKG
ncbi:MAG: hypothetical protein Ct9H300mP21_10180 [Pseudomonadota bacterium]|nr:MAG: hypothetical protein Ct9H300mP21_10180 [Pseudomonadota bacterium]